MYTKKRVFVVYGNYKDDPEYPIGAEEEHFDTIEDAEKAAEEMRQDERFESVTIEEAEREFYVRRKGR